MDLLTLNLIVIAVVAVVSAALYAVRRHLKRRLEEIDGLCGIVNADDADVIDLTQDK